MVLLYLFCYTENEIFFVLDENTPYQRVVKKEEGIR